MAPARASIMRMNSIQAALSRADVAMRMIMQSTTAGERRRTVVALLSASFISVVVWGLVIVLNVH